jgi:hypothetical protein
MVVRVQREGAVWSLIQISCSHNIQFLNAPTPHP